MEARDDAALVLQCPNCDSALGILREDIYDRLQEQWQADGKTGPPVLTAQETTCYAVRASFVPATPAYCPMCSEKVGETGGLN